MLGPEIIIALCALVLATLAWGIARSQAARAQRTMTILQSDQQIQTDGMRETLAQVRGELERSSGGVELQAFRKLAATVKVLELRALEHDALLCSLVTEDEARHLWNAARDESAKYDRHLGVETELRSLVRRGLLKKRFDFKIHELPSSFELREHFELSDTGEMLLALRKHLKETDIRMADSLPPREADSGIVRTVVPKEGPPPFIQSAS